ncbi:hypothetical protein PWT90_09669 [Aphanocladium album]|nr:hypothetical protein PWT90_09669 [Aphanocladium album]
MPATPSKRRHPRIFSAQSALCRPEPPLGWHQRDRPTSIAKRTVQGLNKPSPQHSPSFPNPAWPDQKRWCRELRLRLRSALVPCRGLCLTQSSSDGSRSFLQSLQCSTELASLTPPSWQGTDDADLLFLAPFVLADTGIIPGVHFLHQDGFQPQESFHVETPALEIRLCDAYHPALCIVASILFCTALMNPERGARHDSSTNVITWGLPPSGTSCTHTHEWPPRACRRLSSSLQLPYLVLVQMMSGSERMRLQPVISRVGSTTDLLRSPASSLNVAQFSMSCARLASMPNPDRWVSQRLVSYRRKTLHFLAVWLAVWRGRTGGCVTLPHSA